MEDNRMDNKNGYSSFVNRSNSFVNQPSDFVNADSSLLSYLGAGFTIGEISLLQQGYSPMQIFQQYEGNVSPAMGREAEKEYQLQQEYIRQARIAQTIQQNAVNTAMPSSQSVENQRVQTLMQMKQIQEQRRQAQLQGQMGLQYPQQGMGVDQQGQPSDTPVPLPKAIESDMAGARFYQSPTTPVPFVGGQQNVILDVLGMFAWSFAEEWTMGLIDIIPGIKELRPVADTKAGRIAGTLGRVAGIGTELLIPTGIMSTVGKGAKLASREVTKRTAEIATKNVVARGFKGKVAKEIVEEIVEEAGETVLGTGVQVAVTKVGLANKPSALTSLARRAATGKISVEEMGKKLSANFISNLEQQFAKHGLQNVLSPNEMAYISKIVVDTFNDIPTVDFVTGITKYLVKRNIPNATAFAIGNGIERGFLFGVSDLVRGTIYSYADNPEATFGEHLQQGVRKGARSALTGTFAGLISAIPMGKETSSLNDFLNATYAKISNPKLLQQMTTQQLSVNLDMFLRENPNKTIIFSKKFLSGLSDGDRKIIQSFISKSDDVVSLRTIRTIEEALGNSPAAKDLLLDVHKQLRREFATELQRGAISGATRAIMPNLMKMGLGSLVLNADLLVSLSRGTNFMDADELLFHFIMGGYMARSKSNWATHDYDSPTFGSGQMDRLRWGLMIMGDRIDNPILNIGDMGAPEYNHLSYNNDTNIQNALKVFEDNRGIFKQGDNGTSIEERWNNRTNNQGKSAADINILKDADKKYYDVFHRAWSLIRAFIPVNQYKALSEITMEDALKIGKEISEGNNAELNKILSNDILTRQYIERAVNGSAMNLLRMGFDTLKRALAKIGININDLKEDGISGVVPTFFTNKEGSKNPQLQEFLSYIQNLVDLYADVGAISKGGNGVAIDTPEKIQDALEALKIIKGVEEGMTNDIFKNTLKFSFNSPVFATYIRGALNYNVIDKIRGIATGENPSSPAIISYLHSIGILTPDNKIASQAVKIKFADNVSPEDKNIILAMIDVVRTNYNSDDNVGGGEISISAKQVNDFIKVLENNKFPTSKNAVDVYRAAFNDIILTKLASANLDLEDAAKINILAQSGLFNFGFSSLYKIELGANIEEELRQKVAEENKIELPEGTPKPSETSAGEKVIVKLVGGEGIDIADANFTQKVEWYNQIVQELSKKYNLPIQTKYLDKKSINYGYALNQFLDTYGILSKYITEDTASQFIGTLGRLSAAIGWNNKIGFLSNYQSMAVTNYLMSKKYLNAEDFFVGEVSASIDDLIKQLRQRFGNSGNVNVLIAGLEATRNEVEKIKAESQKKKVEQANKIGLPSQEQGQEEDAISTLAQKMSLFFGSPEQQDVILMALKEASESGIFKIGDEEIPVQIIGKNIINKVLGVVDEDVRRIQAGMLEELRLKSEQIEKDLKSYLENGVGNSKDYNINNLPNQKNMSLKTGISASDVETLFLSGIMIDRNTGALTINDNLYDNFTNSLTFKVGNNDISFDQLKALSDSNDSNANKARELVTQTNNFYAGILVSTFNSTTIDELSASIFNKSITLSKTGRKVKHSNLTKWWASNGLVFERVNTEMNLSENGKRSVVDTAENIEYHTKFRYVLGGSNSRISAFDENGLPTNIGKRLLYSSGHPNSFYAIELTDNNIEVIKTMFNKAISDIKQYTGETIKNPLQGKTNKQLSDSELFFMLHISHLTHTFGAQGAKKFLFNSDNQDGFKMLKYLKQVENRNLTPENLSLIKHIAEKTGDNETLQAIKNIFGEKQTETVGMIVIDDGAKGSPFDLQTLYTAYWTRDKAASGVDGALFVSKDLYRILSAYGVDDRNSGAIKGNIVSNGSKDGIIMIGKVAIFYSPDVQELIFDKNKGVDVVAFKSGIKYLNSDTDDSVKNKVITGISSIDEIGKRISPHTILQLQLDSFQHQYNFAEKSPASISNQYSNFVDNPLVSRDLYDTFSRRGIEILNEVLENMNESPEYVNAMLRLYLGVENGFDEDLSIDSNISLAKRIIMSSPFATLDMFGDSIRNNAVKRLFIDRYLQGHSEKGGKAVLVPYALRRQITGVDLPHAIIDPETGQLSQFGGVELPYYAGDITLSKEDISFIIHYTDNTKSGEPIEREKPIDLDTAIKMFGNDIDFSNFTVKSIMDVLGNINKRLEKSRGTRFTAYSKRTVDGKVVPVQSIDLATMISRSPSVKPDDLAVFKVKTILDKKYGNTIYFNPLDVNYTLEGDYDIDSASFFWGLTHNSMKHFANRKQVGAIEANVEKPTYFSKRLFDANPEEYYREIQRYKQYQAKQTKLRGAKVKVEAINGYLRNSKFKLSYLENGKHVVIEYRDSDDAIMTIASNIQASLDSYNQIDPRELDIDLPDVRRRLLFENEYIVNGKTQKGLFVKTIDGQEVELTKQEIDLIQKTIVPYSKLRTLATGVWDDGLPAKSTIDNIKDYAYDYGMFLTDPIKYIKRQYGYTAFANAKSSKINASDRAFLDQIFANNNNPFAEWMGRLNNEQEMQPFERTIINMGKALSKKREYLLPESEHRQLLEGVLDAENIDQYAIYVHNRLKTYAQLQAHIRWLNNTIRRNNYTLSRSAGIYDVEKRNRIEAYYRNLSSIYYNSLQESKKLSASLKLDVLSYNSEDWVTGASQALTMGYFGRLTSGRLEQTINDIKRLERELISLSNDAENIDRTEIQKRIYNILKGKGKRPNTITVLFRQVEGSNLEEQAREILISQMYNPETNRLDIENVLNRSIIDAISKESEQDAILMLTNYAMPRVDENAVMVLDGIPVPMYVANRRMTRIMRILNDIANGEYAGEVPISRTKAIELIDQISNIYSYNYHKIKLDKVFPMGDDMSKFYSTNNPFYYSPSMTRQVEEFYGIGITNMERSLAQFQQEPTLLSRLTKAWTLSGMMSFETYYSLVNTIANNMQEAYSAGNYSAEVAKYMQEVVELSKKEPSVVNAILKTSLAHNYFKGVNIVDFARSGWNDKTIIATDYQKMDNALNLDGVVTPDGTKKVNKNCL